MEVRRKNGFQEMKGSLYYFLWRRKKKEKFQTNLTELLSSGNSCLRTEDVNQKCSHTADSWGFLVF